MYALPKEIKKYSLKWNVMFIYLLFISCWENIPIVGNVLSHIDELFVLLLFLYVTNHFNYILKKKKLLLSIWIIFLSLGLLSTLVFCYQNAIPSMIDGIIITNRFMLGYFSAIIYFKEKNRSYKIETIIPTVKIIIVSLFVIALHDTFLTPIFYIVDVKYGVNVQSMMFGHPTYLAFAGIILLILLSYNSKEHQNLAYKLMISYVIFVTFRSKAMAFVVVYWLIYIYFFLLRQRYIITIGSVALLSGLLVGRKQIMYYFLGGVAFSPRSILLMDSIKLAIKHFPLGTGFGTFASSIAAQYYSPLYVELGYQKLEGMGLNGKTSYLSDSFWPCIMAQFGFIGTVFFIIVVVGLLKSTFDKIKVDKKAGFAMLMIMVYLLIASVAETSFFNPAAFLSAMILGLYEMKNSNL